MKSKRKFISLILLALLMFSGFSFNLPTAQADAGSVLVSEGFENWNDNGWTLVRGGGIETSAPDPVHQGVYSRYFYGTTGGAYNNFAYLTVDGSNNAQESISAWFWRLNNPYGMPSTNILGEVSICGLASYYSGSIQYGAMIGYYTYNGTVVYVARKYTGSGNSDYYGINDVAVAVEDWEQVSIVVNFDPTDGFAKFYVNGIEIYELTGNFGVPTGQRRIWMGVTSAHVTFINAPYYLDDLSAGGLFVSADLEPDDTGSDWVFTDWRYYTFTVTVPSGFGQIDFLYLGFTEIPLANGTFGFAAWSNGTNWDCASNLAYESRDLEPIRVKTGSWSIDSDIVVTFPLWFTKRCLDIWLDENAVDALIMYNTTDGYESGWLIAYADLFRIYTDGGFSRVSDGYGDSGALPGGREFNMFAYNDSYVFKDLYWRNLQHIKMVPEIQFRAGYQYFQFNWGVDYVLQDGTYQPGLHLQLEPDAVSYTGVFASNVWINYTASWYANNSLIKSEDLYAFYHGEVYTAGDYGRVKFFIDFWFDAGNASSLQGGRINAYEFPMKDDSGAWFRWLSSNWGVKDDVQKQSECIAPLIKYEAEEYINSERIEFVRVWSSLTVPGAQYNQYVAAINYDVFDLTLGENPLKGISTPPWDETNMPAMRNTGVLGAIWSMFQGIAKWIGDNILFGGLSLWTTFVAFLDTIAGWLGAPYFFTNLFNWIGEGFGYLINSAGYAWTVIASIFIMIGQLLAAFITTLGELITSFVTTLSMFVDFMGGGLGAAGNLWDTFQISTWITLAIIFYPIYLIILWDQKGLDAVITQLTWIFGILVWLYGFFRSLIELIIHFITGLIESIPVAE